MISVYLQIISKYIMPKTLVETVQLNAKNRVVHCELSIASKALEFEVSRKDCKDVLVEFVDELGNAQSKPLEKCLPSVKLKKEIVSIRFIMNEMSVKPIDVNIFYK